MKLINKLRANFQLSNLLIRIFFVLAYVLYSWQTSLAVATVMMEQTLGGSFNLFTAIMASVILGVILMFLVPVLCNVFLNYSHFYTVPRAEFALLTHLFVAIFFAISGLLKLVNLFTPILVVWGNVLFPVLTSIGCAIWFYHVTSNLYFNNQTKPYYFRNLSIVYIILLVVAEVLL